MVTFRISIQLEFARWNSCRDVEGEFGKREKVDSDVLSVRAIQKLGMACGGDIGAHVGSGRFLYSEG